MFESAQKYSSMARDHIAEARHMLDRYNHLIEDGDDQTALDVGSGSGNVTVDALGKIRNWKKIVGFDYNQKMVNFANQNSPNADKFSFELINFNEPIDSQLFQRKFDKIFSFFALQWMNNRRTVAQNMYNLLQPNGQIFLLIVSHSKIYEVWDELAKSERWSQFIKVSRPLNELVYEECPGKMFTEPLEEAGFKIIKSEVIKRKNIFQAPENTDESRLEKLKTVDPFLVKIPEEQREEYLQDLLHKVVTQVGVEGATDYTALVIVAKKSSC